MAMPVNERKQITSQNIFTNLVQLDGKFQILISGLTDSTVTFQATLDGVTFHDIETFTSNGIHVGEVASNTYKYRVGIKTGGYGSDTVLVHMEA
jgi:hypothetical protein